jgi:hypothetical protein
MAGNPKRGPAVPPGYPPAAQPPPNQYANPAEQARITSPNTPGKIAPLPPEPRTTGQTPGQAPTGRGGPPQEANPANTPNWNPNLYAGGTKPFPGAPPPLPQQGQASYGPTLTQAQIDQSNAYSQAHPENTMVHYVPGYNANGPIPGYGQGGNTSQSDLQRQLSNMLSGPPGQQSNPNIGTTAGNQGYANAGGGKGGQGGGFSPTGAMAPPQRGSTAFGGGRTGGAQMPGGMQAGANTATDKGGGGGYQPQPPPPPTQAPANTAGGKGPQRQNNYVQ